MSVTIIESSTKTVKMGFEEPFCIIGERINPTGRKRLSLELQNDNFSTVEQDVLNQVKCGAHILDVNAGVVYNKNPDLAVHKSLVYHSLYMYFETIHFFLYVLVFECSYYTGPIKKQIY